MRISKTLINVLLVFSAFAVLTTVTTIVQAKQNSEKVLSIGAVKYELPFPGILPDHPLYKIKMARDRLWEFLISDLEKKAYFEILMADKRMSACRMLIEDRGKTDLGLSTAGKAYKYLEKTPPIIKALREKNYNTNNLIDKLEISTGKHLFLLNKFLTRKELTSAQSKEIKNLIKMYSDFVPKATSLR